MNEAAVPDPLMTGERLDGLERRMDAVEKWQKDAVPNADHVGHSRYHALMIENIEERRRLRRAVLEKSIAGLVWGTMIFIGLAAWNYFLSIVRKGG